MRAAKRDAVTYKLPASFVAAHRDMLDAIEWHTDTVTLAMGWQHDPVLEIIMRRGERIVRPATPKSAVLIRRYSETLPS